MILGELTTLEFGKSVHWTEQKVHFDQSTSTKALKDKDTVELFRTPQVSCLMSITPTLNLLKHV